MRILFVFSNEYENKESLGIPCDKKIGHGHDGIRKWY